jgi:hypothetical protein
VIVSAEAIAERGGCWGMAVSAVPVDEGGCVLVVSKDWRCVEISESEGGGRRSLLGGRACRVLAVRCD